MFGRKCDQNNYEQETYASHATHKTTRRDYLSACPNLDTIFINIVSVDVRLVLGHHSKQRQLKYKTERYIDISKVEISTPIIEINQLFVTWNTYKSCKINRLESHQLFIPLGMTCDIRINFRKLWVNFVVSIQCPFRHSSSCRLTNDMHDVSVNLIH